MGGGHWRSEGPSGTRPGGPLDSGVASNLWQAFGGQNERGIAIKMTQSLLSRNLLLSRKDHIFLNNLIRRRGESVILIIHFPLRTSVSPVCKMGCMCVCGWVGGRRPV